MGMTLPSYSYQPPGYVAKTYPNAFVWFVSGAQQLDVKPYSMCLSCKVYASIADYQAGYGPIEILALTLDDPADMGAIVYGHTEIVDPLWVIPQAPDPYLQHVVGPLRGLKLETAFLIRKHPVLGQVGAQWD